ncbi:MAG: hypothetical protein J4N63_04015 [Chloroflexi bacterium]|nr:hypothetical protein [Chloroflexota bacterium]MCI0882244.1 hypothetical protein [Chloroflexota bacterium]
MIISVFSRTVAILLVASVVLVTVLAYSGSGEGSCDPTCFDIRIAVAIIAFGLFGAAVSASISQFSKPRTPGTRRLTKIGVAIYLLTSFATFIFLPGLASLALFVFIPTGIVIVVMIAAREAW